MDRPGPGSCWRVGRWLDRRTGHRTRRPGGLPAGAAIQGWSAAAVGGGQADEPRTGLNSVEMLLTIGVGPSRASEPGAEVAGPRPGWFESYMGHQIAIAAAQTGQERPLAWVVALTLGGAQRSTTRGGHRRQQPGRHTLKPGRADPGPSRPRHRGCRTNDLRRSVPDSLFRPPPT